MRWMLRQPETIDQCVDSTCGCNCDFCWLEFFSLARVCNGFVMIACASELGKRVVRYSWLLGGVGVITKPDVGLDTTQPVQSVCVVPPGAGMLWLLVPGMVVGVFFNLCFVAELVDVTCWVISATRELFCKDEGVQFWHWIAEATELPPWRQSLSPGGTQTHPLAGGSWECPGRPKVWLIVTIRMD